MTQGLCFAIRKGGCTVLAGVVAAVVECDKGDNLELQKALRKRGAFFVGRRLTRWQI